VRMHVAAAPHSGIAYGIGKPIPLMLCRRDVEVGDGWRVRYSNVIIDGFGNLCEVDLRSNDEN
uniref:hypothetical protein n=1 Tax=Brevibacterium sp. Ap13 TaxID=1406197 RepID=UPI001F2C2F7A